MKIEKVTIEQKEYPLCCGLAVMAKLQEKHKTLEQFTKALIGDADGEANIHTIIETLKLMNECGAKATNGALIEDQVIETMCYPFEVAADLLRVYMNALMPTNPEEESQTKKDMTE